MILDRRRGRDEAVAGGQGSVAADFRGCRAPGRVGAAASGATFSAPAGFTVQSGWPGIGGVVVP